MKKEQRPKLDVEGTARNIIKLQKAINSLRRAVKYHDKVANDWETIFYLTAVSNAGLRVKKAAKRLLDVLEPKPKP